MVPRNKLAAWLNAISFGGIELIIEGRLARGGLRRNSGAEKDRQKQRAQRADRASPRPGTSALRMALILQPLVPECRSLHGPKLPRRGPPSEPEVQYVL
jgi:hypothetical protein